MVSKSLKLKQFTKSDVANKRINRLYESYLDERIQQTCLSNTNDKSSPTTVIENDSNSIYTHSIEWKSDVKVKEEPSPSVCKDGFVLLTDAAADTADHKESSTTKCHPIEGQSETNSITASGVTDIKKTINKKATRVPKKENNNKNKNNNSNNNVSTTVYATQIITPRGMNPQMKKLVQLQHLSHISQRIVASNQQQRQPIILHHQIVNQKIPIIIQNPHQLQQQQQLQQNLYPQLQYNKLQPIIVPTIQLVNSYKYYIPQNQNN